MGAAETVMVRPVAELLAENAARHGDKLAFADDRRGVSWAELDRRTARLAAGFGVERGTRVAFCLDNGVELVEGLLATVRAAAVGVPLPPRATHAELAQLLADCDPAVVVTDQRRLPRIAGMVAGRPVRLVVIGEGEVPQDVRHFEDLVLDGRATPRDDLGLDEPAWLLYTSGTSGTPTAAVSSQRSALWSSFACYLPRLGLTDTDRVLWPLPLAHTYAHSLCVLGTTVAGASARITSAPDPARLVRLLGEFEPTVLGGVPLTFRQLLDSGLGAVPSLRVCVTAGAPSDAELRQEVERRFGAPLLDGYGSTETCGKIAMESLSGPRVPGGSGTPLPGMEVRLVAPDSGLDVAAAGSGRNAVPGEGEIWVRGPGVMLGYHNRPEAGADAVRDGWYRTGDLGRLGTDGCLTVTGRLGDRIVRGGENVDPAEVERVLRALPGVLDAAVVARPHPLLGEVPVAFVVPAEQSLDPAGLLRGCAAVLSAHKVPEEVLFTPAVPRTAAGKPRRAVLRETLAERPPAPDLARLAALTAGERRSALTELVCAQAEAIRGAAADPGTAFADLGLTSLDAMTLWHRLSVRTGLRLPATLVWDHPNPAAVAAYLDARMSGDAPAPAAPATTAPRRGPDPDPVAIVAVGCRYPGGVSAPEDLWRLVRDGVDATGDFPADRGWDLDALHDPDPDRLGTTYTRRGGFLDGAADFDPLFFGISPREALATDPQHRLLLEVAWETLERAGIPAPSLRGSSTGVYVGLMHAGYGTGLSPHELESHIGIGSAGSLASGRISYVLGLRGPTITLDTACSSSLVAMDLAARALRAGECTLALAGGVTVLSSPQPFIAFSRQRGLSADGRCRSFAEGAEGTAWAEGVGLVLLEKLSDARRGGHPVLAVLRGSAVNSDGASNGLTAPNGEAQRELIRLTLADAGLGPADVDVIEGHGTGTALGDPIEAGAVLATYGQDRDPADPVWLGSVKSNLGHSQAAAGVAGVIKMIEAMRHGELPRSLHAERPSPHVDWSAGAVRLLDRARPWPERDRPRRAAVSSFGIGGTNAHVIIEEPSEADGTAGTGSWSQGPARQLPAPSWLVSGSDEAGLRAHAAKLAAALADATDEAAPDIAYSLATTRTALPRRACVTGADVSELLDGLRQLARGEESPALLRNTVRGRPGLALLCAGQGTQRIGMGRELAAAFPVFDSAFSEVCEWFRPLLDRPLREVIDDADSGLLHRTDYAQPALFAFEVAVHTLLAQWGVRPDYLVGHSVGELTAAYLAGVFSLGDAVRLVAARGRLMAALPAGGAMVAVRAPEAEVARRLGGTAGRVAIAAVNGPASVVLSGDEAAVTALAGSFGGRSTALRVSHAFHSPLLDPMLDEFRAVAETVTYRPPSVPVVSTVTGRPEPDALATAGYWVRQARETVRFADAVDWLAEAGVTAFVEAGPAAALSVAAEDCVAPDAGAVFAPFTDARAALAGLAALHVHGVTVDWPSVYADSGARRHPLPTYPFQRQRYWLNAVRHSAPTRHPLLGEPQPDADGPGVRHRGVLSVVRQSWLADHAIDGRVLVPATAFAELVCHAAGTSGPVRLTELSFREPLELPESEQVSVQVVTGGPDEAGNRPVTVFSRSGEAWTRHATAIVAPVGAAPVVPFRVWPPAGAEQLPVDYERLAEHGHHYGPAFRAVTRLWRKGTSLFAELALPPREAATAGSYTLHPALLDAALHAALLAEGPGEARVPLTCAGLTVHATGAVIARAHLERLGPDELRVTLTDPAGQPIAAVESLVTRVLPGGRPGARAELYGLAWRPSAPGGAGDTRHELLDLATLVGKTDEPGTASPDGEAVTLATDLDTAPAGRTGLAEDTDPPARVRTLLAATLTALQDWIAGARPGRLLVLTHNATGDDPDPAEAAVAGLVRSAQSEHPGRIVLVDRRGGTASPADLDAALRTGEPQVALRDGVVLAPRLSAVEPGTAAPALDPEGTVLITGGTGALAASLARYLVAEHGVRHLVVASRGGRSPEWAAGLDAQVRAVACEVSDRAAVDALVASCRPAPTAVFHLAGVVDDGVVDGLTPERLATVLAPKADGAWHLHEATKELGLSAFVLYSSAAGVLGRPGQANYAAANGFLDALARHRIAHGLPAQSLAWGPWTTADDTGMAAQVPAHRLGDGGILAVGEEEGVALLDRALRTPEPVLVPLPLNLKALGGPVTPPVLRDLVPKRPAVAPAAAAATAAPQAPGAWRERLATVPVPGREAVLVELIRAELALLLGFEDVSALPEDREFGELGFDSLMAVQLRNRLSAFTRVRLASTVVYDHPTLPALAAHVHEVLRGVLPGTEAEGAPVADADEPSSYGFGTLYHRVLRERGPVEAMGLRYLASHALASFSLSERTRYTVAPVRLARGRGTPLVYIPDYLTPYHRTPAGLAKQFDGERDLFLLEHPGLGERKAVPQSAAAVVRTHADTVCALSPDAPVVLVGFCAGGAIAQAVAHELAAAGRAPAGLILLDAHRGVLRRDDERALALMAAGAELPDEVVAEFEDSLLIAGGGYARVLENWEPEPSPVPTLLVRGRPTAQMLRNDPDGDWRPDWPLAHGTAETVDVPGDHYTLVHHDADTTAAAMRAWLTA
ncbi:type I polyketide synthase [Streptomyces sp. S.PB5]|uniref:type I polyketide synthase n=1 Tax=Streptomyces sp. S.PB5 TaxID=3020844 RepID=UPI0025B19227|nr:type I polyketide synthase [Streptomyces sp. S.PB5]MDN3024017.1 type I polyketide synthase [Streptomyces sp. S.PB5]